MVTTFETFPVTSGMGIFQCVDVICNVSLLGENIKNYIPGLTPEMRYERVIAFKRGLVMLQKST